MSRLDKSSSCRAYKQTCQSPHTSRSSSATLPSITPGWWTHMETTPGLEGQPGSLHRWHWTVEQIQTHKLRHMCVITCTHKQEGTLRDTTSWIQCDDMWEHTQTGLEMRSSHIVFSETPLQECHTWTCFVDGCHHCPSTSSKENPRRELSGQARWKLDRFGLLELKSFCQSTGTRGGSVYWQKFNFVMSVSFSNSNWFFFLKPITPPAPILP